MFQVARDALRRLRRLRRGNRCIGHLAQQLTWID